MKTLASVLGRPALARVPELAIRMVFGEMGQETILSGQKVIPRQLLDSGFQFEHPELREALVHELRSLTMSVVRFSCLRWSSLPLPARAGEVADAGAPWSSSPLEASRRPMRAALDSFAAPGVRFELEPRNLETAARPSSARFPT
jgi:hypothetical protein